MTIIQIGTAAVAVAAAGFMCGCETIGGGASASHRKDFEIQQLERVQATAARHNKILKRQLANARENAKIYQEQARRWSVKLDSIQGAQARLERVVGPLERRLAKLEKENHRLAAKIAAVKRELDSEKQARRKELRDFSEQVAKETATAINQATSDLRRAPPPSLNAGGHAPVGPGEFYKHKVERGHTLSVIAKAYNVSVSDIKRANRLKSDVIRVGQILYVPKK